MTDYEYLFSTNLHAKLKERIQGGIFVKVNENDSLVVAIKRKDGNNFDMSFTDFSKQNIEWIFYRLCSVWSTEKISEICDETIFQNELRDSAETSGLLFLWNFLYNKI